MNGDLIILGGFMAEVTLTIPADKVVRVAAAFGVSTIPEFKAKLLAYIKNIVYDYERSQASEAGQIAINTAEENKQATIEAIQEDSEIVA